LHGIALATTNDVTSRHLGTGFGSSRVRNKL